MLTISGGKLTTYRAMAAEAVDEVVRRLRRRAREPLTHRRPLPGGELASVEGEVAAAAQTTGDPEAAAWMVRAHGTRWRRVWSLCETDRRLRERLDPELPYLAAEVAHATTHELACTLGDVLLRRTHLAFETRDHGRAAAERAADVMAPLLAWDAAQREAMMAHFEAEIARLFTIEP
jgi:glycerol-3-phosphate dehydrogenase